MLIIVHPRSFEDQRWIGCRINSPEAADSIHVARIGNNGCHGFQLIEFEGIALPFEVTICILTHEWEHCCLGKRFEAAERGIIWFRLASQRPRSRRRVLNVTNAKARGRPLNRVPLRLASHPYRHRPR